MSHVTTVDSIPITDLDALARAAATLGLELRRGQEAYKWYGRYVGDAPLPTGFTKEELGHCEHALAVVGNDRAYEIGLARRRDGQPGYTLLYDAWGGGYGLEAAAGTDLHLLLQEYTLEGVRATMPDWNVVHERDSEGKLHVTMTEW